MRHMLKQKQTKTYLQTLSTECMLTRQNLVGATELLQADGALQKI